MDNRNGLLMDVRIADASPKSEPETALRMVDETVAGSHRVTVGADRGYDTKGFVEGARQLNVTPHVAQYRKGEGRRGSAVDARTTRHRGYRSSLLVRMRIEQVFGWMKTAGQLPQDPLSGQAANAAGGLHGRRGLQPAAHCQARCAVRLMAPGGVQTPSPGAFRSLETAEHEHAGIDRLLTSPRQGALSAPC